ncbi:ABC transporter ATP-binding protein [Actinomadura fibrosa]|uniref:ABC transporter ATP-binding protein n=1 Tax=Actinomadura fibrosa TaxID=111802 RepID=A0ABW2XVZ6_9ACTN
MLRDLRADPVPAAAGAGAALAATAARLAQPALLAAVVDAVVRRSPVARPLTALAAVLAAGLAGTVAAGYLDTRREAAATRRHRARLLAHALRLSPSDERFAPGDLLSRLVTDAKAPARLATVALSTVTTTLLSAGGMAALALVDPWLCLLVAAEIAAVGLLVRLFLRGAGAAEQRYQAARGELAARLVDAHRGVRTIRASGTGDREARRILAPLGEIRSAGLASWRAQRDVTWRVGLVNAVMRAAVLLVAGLGVLHGGLTPGELVAALGYSTLALGMAHQVDPLTTLALQRAATRRVIEVLDAPVPVRADPPVPLPEPGGGAVRFVDVTVRRDGRTVLDGVDLAVPPGAHVAVVGRSGTGKSLLVALVGRLAEADAGCVELDGADVRALDPAELRRAVAYAFEEPRLFGSSLREAILAGSAWTDGAAERAAVQARADGFIGRLPRGYATPVEEAPMSGGELQRVGLARALARPARVLVLDDATSSLDTATEAEVRLAIAAAWKDRTALVVAHRARTAAAADLVAWLDDGRLRALRPHRELWNDPAYRAVFRPPAVEPPAACAEGGGAPLAAGREAG